MTKHLLILGVACVGLLVGLAGCVSQNPAPPTDVQNHGDVPPAPGSTEVSSGELNAPVQ